MIAKITVVKTERRLSGVNHDKYEFDVVKEGDNYVAIRDDGKRFKITTDMVEDAPQYHRRVTIEIINQGEWEKVIPEPGSIYCEL